MRATRPAGSDPGGALGARRSHFGAARRLTEA
jgi:hypothetical protein